VEDVVTYDSAGATKWKRSRDDGDQATQRAKEFQSTDTLVIKTKDVSGAQKFPSRIPSSKEKNYYD
jgi:hypothetical protein